VREVSVSQLRRLAGGVLAEKTEDALGNADHGVAIYRGDRSTVKCVVSFGGPGADLPGRFPPAMFGDLLLDAYVMPEPVRQQMVSPLLRHEPPPQIHTRRGRSGLLRMLPRRVHGVTSNHVLDELVRLPGDSSRTTATSLTRRAGEVDPAAPGEGEWRGPTHRIIPAPPKRDPAYDRDFNRRTTAFAEALAEAEVDPALSPVVIQATIDALVGFRDRRYSGRRYRPTDNYALLDGPQEPYPPPGPIDQSTYRPW
jgi:hypothetical protein